LLVFYLYVATRLLQFKNRLRDGLQLDCPGGVEVRHFGKEFHLFLNLLDYGAVTLLEQVRLVANVADLLVRIHGYCFYQFTNIPSSLAIVPPQALVLYQEGLRKGLKPGHIGLDQSFLGIKMLILLLDCRKQGYDVLD
jgi:hypothetical protein